MHHIIWKPISFCAALVMDKKNGERAVVEPRRPSDIAKQAHENRLREALEKVSVDGFIGKSQGDGVEENDDNDPFSALFQRSRSLARLNAQKDFVRATAQAADRVFDDESSLPEMDEAYEKFKRMYPKYSSSCKVDELRYDEYCHLEEYFNPDKKVCLDYCGFGLFSYLQQFESSVSSTFGLSEISVNLCNHALYGAPEHGTVEHDIRQRIMEFLNIQESEYSMVFTVSRGSAFKLLAESYPFQNNKRLLTMYDYESESVNLMAESARERGAKVQSASFRWPTLKVCSNDLRKQILKKTKRKKDSSAGLFVFPVQSRVSGTKYSYQWMSLAQQNNWHVLLDAGSLGPKDMDSLGLSLFRPDFIITSFYKVFGLDPTGFGCLFIKRTMMSKLYLKEGAAASGMVKIVPVFPQYLGGSMELDEVIEEEGEASEDRDYCGEELERRENGLGNGPSVLPAFSGAFSLAKVKDSIAGENENNSASDRDGSSTIFEETESVSTHEIMKSPISTEGDTDHSYCIDLGQSPNAFPNSSQLKRGYIGSPNIYSPLHPLKVTESRIYGGQSNEKKKVEQGSKIMSFDAAVLSVSQDLDRTKIEDGSPNSNSIEHVSQNVVKIMSKGDGTMVNSNGLQSVSLDINGNCSNFDGDKVYRTHTNEISNEISDSDHNSIFPEGSKRVEDARHSEAENGNLTKENAIRRETEGEFRLLGGRRGPSLQGSRVLGGGMDDDLISDIARSVSFEIEADVGRVESFALQSESESEGALVKEESVRSEKKKWERRDPEIICRHLDHIDGMGLNKTTSRLRYLVNWLIASLLQLRHKGLNSGINLVHIYGPKIKYERGSAVAFNLYDSKGNLINPEAVQKLADKENISLGLGFLSHVVPLENHSGKKQGLFSHDTHLSKPVGNGRVEGKKAGIRVEVLTISLGFLSNFEDVYKLWAFVAKFLNPGYVQGESRQPSSLSEKDQ